MRLLHISQFICHVQGHFNVKAVRLSALAIVYPGLTCIYFGQAAFLIKRPDQIGTLYYNAIPHPLFWPAFVIALLAAIVASQAIITGKHWLMWKCSRLDGSLASWFGLQTVSLRHWSMHRLEDVCECMVDLLAVLTHQSSIVFPCCTI